MELKNYSTIRIAPYVFKINEIQTLQEYLDNKEKITYEIYQEGQNLKPNQEKNKNLKNIK